MKGQAMEASIRFAPFVITVHGCKVNNVRTYYCFELLIKKTKAKKQVRNEYMNDQYRS